MIVIFSISNDGTTTEVIEWIKKISTQKIIRINSDKSKLRIIAFDEQKRKFLIQLKNEIYNLFDVKSYWYRKGHLIHWSNVYYDEDNIEYEGLSKGFQRKLISENKVINEFIHYFLESHSLVTLGSKFNATLNKLNILNIAKKLNLCTPLTYIFDNKTDLKEKIDRNDDLITKALSDGMYAFNNTYSYYSYTELIDKKSHESIADNFFPSLFQEKIEKSYEVRAFYLDGKMYSMAIFSQKNKKTAIDFRKYDGELPNRCIPYKLPNDILQKTILLFNQLNLNTGSVDYIVNTNGEHIFLEINPVGQFSMVSSPCNYFLEKEVANYLMNYK